MPSMPLTLNGKDIPDYKNGWLCGTVDRISMPYGSRFDLMSLQVALCDDCVEEGLSKRRIIVLSGDISKEVI